jgi:serine protease Do
MSTQVLLSRLFNPETGRRAAAPSNNVQTLRQATPGWLGIIMQPITPEIAAALGLNGVEGALIADVVPDGPAAKAGLAIGHVITRYAGQEVVNVRRLARAVADTAAGTPLGLSLGWLPERLRRRAGLPAGGMGALVVDVLPESGAADHGIQVGDIVMRVDDVEVHDPIDASNAVKSAELGHKMAVAVLINRAGTNRFVGVPLGDARG